MLVLWRREASSRVAMLLIHLYQLDLVYCDVHRYDCLRGLLTKKTLLIYAYYSYRYIVRDNSGLRL